MTRVNYQSIFALNISKLIKFVIDSGYEITFGEAYRTPTQQYLYYNGLDIDYQTKQLIRAKKRSKTLLSKHLDRLAVDFNFFLKGVWIQDFDHIKPFGDYWESLHPRNRWGGDFNNNDIEDGFVDVPHFEMNI